MVGHPAGPFTIHFWAPTCKWLLSVSNLADLERPTDTISLAQTTGDPPARACHRSVPALPLLCPCPSTFPFYPLMPLCPLTLLLALAALAENLMRY